MKRIALVTDFFRPDPGGLEGLFTGIARRWDPASIVTVVTRDAAHSHSAEEELRRFDRGEAYPILRLSLNSSAWHSASQRREQQVKVRQALDQARPDHVLLGDLNQNARRFARAAQAMALPFSVFLNGGDLRDRLGFLNFRERSLLKQARNIFTVARFIARDVRALGVPDERIVVTPPGFEPRWTSRRKSKMPAELAERIGTRILLVGLGPLVPRKGFDLALQALQRLRDLADRLHFVLIGSGPEYIYLQELIRLQGLESMVTMTGFLPDDALYSVLQRADIVIQPGKVREDDVETLGAVFMEAAWMGLPSVAGRLGGVEEVVRHGVSGFITEPGDAAELARRIEELVGSERLRYQLGKNAREIARREFDFARTCYAIDARL